MSADRETNHDMTDSDIALLLADAADEVEIGIAPYQAVIRGGRRRRARRWAVATAAALVIAGRRATLALAGLPGDGDGRRVAPAATQPPTTAAHAFDEPQPTTLATGTEDGKEWGVLVDVWGAPRNEAEAEAQLAAMAEYGETPADVREASELIGKSTYFVYSELRRQDDRGHGEHGPQGGQAWRARTSCPARPPLEPGCRGTRAPRRSARSPRPPRRSTAPGRTARRRWCDRVAARSHGDTARTKRRSARPEGSPDNWFVCLAPKGAEYKSAEVIEVGGRSQPPLLPGLPHRLHAVAGARLADGGGEVVADRRLGQMQLGGDVGDRRAVHGGLEDVALARR